MLSPLPAALGKSLQATEGYLGQAGLFPASKSSIRESILKSERLSKLFVTDVRFPLCQCGLLVL